MVVNVVLSWLHHAIVIVRLNRVMSYSETFLEILKNRISSVFFFLWFFPQKNSGNEKCTIFPFDSLSPNLAGSRSESERLWKFHVDTCQRTFPTSSYPPFAQKLMRFLRVTFSTAYSLKSFLDTESFLNPHFSKSCSFPLTLAVIPFATCWHHFNFFGIIFFYSVKFSSLFFSFFWIIFFAASPPPTGPSLEE